MIIPDPGARAKSFERNPSLGTAVGWRDQTCYHGAVLDNRDFFTNAHAFQPSRQVLSKFGDVDLDGCCHGRETVAGPKGAVKRNEVRCSRGRTAEP
jgi:hypothetical protein